MVPIDLDTSPWRELFLLKNFTRRFSNPRWKFEVVTVFCFSYTPASCLALHIWGALCPSLLGFPHPSPTCGRTAPAPCQSSRRRRDPAGRLDGVVS